MAEEIKDLIEKIQQEGIQAAQDKAAKIEDSARGKAEEIIQKAKLEAEKIIAQAKEQAAKIEASTKTSLKQAGRDLMLSLRKEINLMLDKLIITRLQEALKPEELIKIISALVKNYRGEEKQGIIISLNKEDLERLEKGILSELGEEAKKGITLHPKEDIQAGFTVSFDAGKSHYDFTDKALAEYIGSYLKPKLKEVLE